MHQLGLQRETWDADALEPTSAFIDAADRVVVRLMWRAAGRGPDVPVEVTGVFTVRKGRVVFVEWFWVHAEAPTGPTLGSKPPLPAIAQHSLYHRAI